MNGTNCPPAAGKLLVNGQDARTKQEILQMIVQYLHDEGYTAAVSLRALSRPKPPRLAIPEAGPRLDRCSARRHAGATPRARPRRVHHASFAKPR